VELSSTNLVNMDMVKYITISGYAVAHLKSGNTAEVSREMAEKYKHLIKKD
jgi:hypothetical protein